MNVVRPHILLIGGGLIIISLLSGCSPSSQSQRYNYPKESDDSGSDGWVRFTSEDTVEIKNPDTGEIENPSQDEQDYVLPDVDSFNASEFVKKYKKIKEYELPFTVREKILFEIISYIDTPYKYGGNSENGIDCSAFTQLVYLNSLNEALPRTASEQFGSGQSVSRNEDLRFGDLLFFDTSKRSYPGHVGIFIGENMFAHASRSSGVIVSSLLDDYYSARYIGARRVKDISE